MQAVGSISTHAAHAACGQRTLRQSGVAKCIRFSRPTPARTPNRIRISSRRVSLRVNSVLADGPTRGSSTSAIDVDPAESKQEEQLDWANRKSSSTGQLDPAESKPEEQLDWARAWYPVGPLPYLLPDAPNPVGLLGKSLVVWKGKGGVWHAADERCPHKLASLAMGKVDAATGDLQCRYHGWCFNGQGECTSNPQAADAAQAAAACTNPRAQLGTYPTRVVGGLLFVWPDNTPAGEAAAAGAEPYVPPGAETWEWSLSDTPLGWTMMLENNMDPSHANSLHEGFGFSLAAGVGMTKFQQVGAFGAREGFTLEHNGYQQANKEMAAVRDFTPPCCSETTYQYPSGANATFVIYFVPVAPGVTRVLGNFKLPSFPASGAQKGVPEGAFLGMLKALHPQAVARAFMLAMAKATPTVENVLRWLAPPADVAKGLQHVKFSASLFGLQDQLAMHGVEVSLGEAGSQSEGWARDYCLPTTADVGGIIFRRWLDRFAGGGPKWLGQAAKHGNGNGVAAEEPKVEQMSEVQLLDTWSSHSKICPYCRKAILWLDDVQGRLQKVQVGLLGNGLFLGVVGAASSWWSARAAAVCVALALASVAAGGLARLLSASIADLQRSFTTRLPSFGAPLINLYPKEGAVRSWSGA